MKRLLAAAVLISLCSAPRPAQSQERGAAALGQLVEGLPVDARVLMIGAHPDDEDNALLAWLVQREHADAAYLSLTRGDGGQNLIGNELGDALGIIRTEELLAARRVDGAHQYFTRAYDFGFSKTADETFRHWPQDSLLRDVVTVIRAFRPQVIVSVWTGTPRDGHGQHQAAGILAREAFAAAADSVRFPRSATAGLGAWTTSKYYLVAGYTRIAPTVCFNVGEYNPLLGRTYTEIAVESRSQHKSQGMARRMPALGARMDCLHRERSLVDSGEDASHERSLFDGIDTTYRRLTSELAPGAGRAALDSLPAAIDAARQALRLTAPSGVVAPLARVVRLADRVCAAGGADACVPRDGSGRAPAATLPPDVQQSMITLRERATRALLAASGIAVEADADRELVARREPGDADSLAVALGIYVQGAAAADERGARIDGADLAPARASVAADCCTIAPDSARRERILAFGDSVTAPWWLATPRAGDMFTTPITGVAEDERLPAGQALVALQVAGAPVEARVPVIYHESDPVRGDVARPVAVAPAITITTDHATEYAPAGRALARDVRVALRSAAVGPRTVRVSLRLPAGLVADSATRTVTLPGHDAVRAVVFHLRGRLTPGTHRIAAVAESDGRTYTTGYELIDYPHIRPMRMYRDADVDVHAVDVALPAGLRVAYIPGVGDNVAPMLAELGIPLTVLDPATLATADLSRYTTIVVGTRAYASRPDLVADNARLLDWVRRGGTMVVQYGQYEMQEPGIMPYPIKLARPAARVTEEDAPVRITDSSARVLTTPNRIGPRDFDGWVQERSVYMPSEIDPHYHTVMSMNDPGEPPNPGAILIASYGRGTYVYTTLALFRQLPAGVPGAARLFVNLLAAGEGTHAAARAGAGAARGTP